MVNLDLGLSRKIIDVARATRVTLPQTAYLLATAYWETNGTVMPVREAYYLGAKAEAYRKGLRYYPWYGRGLVQITWESNYREAGARIGEDLISQPDMALDPEVAVRVLVIGSRDGWFTGKRLSHYINDRDTDFVGARRIINGLDQAQAIAHLADQYLAALSPSLPYPALRRGSRGAEVAKAQIALAARGFAVGAADGIFGAMTEQAVRALQRRSGLVVDGVVGPKTWSVLLAEVDT